ncbi:MAG TPA: ABC transporter substrate-binding protein [Solirubrobacteraceae bacterium]|nr:ABC transporter substrate-binding protein [Solirubrobacteraceae bacterium]
MFDAARRSVLRSEKVSRAVLAATLVLAGAAVTACGAVSSAAQGPAQLVYYTPIDSNGTNARAAKTCSEQSGGQYNITLTPEANSSDQSRQLIVQRLAAHYSDIDLINMDTIWTAEFAAAGWLKPITGANRREALTGVLPIAAQSGEYKGTLYAIPLNTNAQLLWYRKDLVHTPPSTWAQLIADAKRLPASDGLIEEQGAEYEGYVVWFNSLLASAGGRVLTADNQPSLGAPAVAAARIIKAVATSGRADPSLSTDQEDQGRLAFEAGHAAFMLNWPYVYAAGRTDAATSPVTKHVWENMGWAPYPGVYPGVPGKSSVGGANIGVSVYSQHPNLAIKAALCMTRYHWQNEEAINEGLPPVTIASYSDPQVVKAYPFASVLLKQLEHATNRPETPLYSDVSLAIQQTLHPPASIQPEQSIKALGSCLKTLINGGLC